MARGARSRQVARGPAEPVCALGTSPLIRSACRRAQEHGMANTGVPLRQVQILAGHPDYATTEKYYAHLPPEGDDRAARKLRF